MPTNTLHVGQRIWFKLTDNPAEPFSETITRVDDKFAITQNNQVIDVRTHQWIHPNGYRTKCPGTFFLSEYDLLNDHPQEVRLWSHA